MNIFEAIVLGAVQGTDRISSCFEQWTPLLYSALFWVNDNNLFFNVMLHVGTLTAVCAVYWRLFLRLHQKFL